MSADERRFQLDGDYRYLSEPYYQTVDAAGSGRILRPTPQQILDAAVVPLSLIKAEQAGLPVPEWYLTNEYFVPPVVCYTVNPFMRRCTVVLQQGRARQVAKRMTRNFQYSVCCQEIEPDTEVREFNIVLGRTPAAEFTVWAERIWEVFGIPLARARLLQFGQRRVLSGLDPLPASQLKPGERKLLEAVVRPNRSGPGL